VQNTLQSLPSFLQLPKKYVSLQQLLLLLYRTTEPSTTNFLASTYVMFIVHNFSILFSIIIYSLLDIPVSNINMSVD
jgi:hypothetical protein